MPNKSLFITFLFILVSLVIWDHIPTSSPLPMFYPSLLHFNLAITHPDYLCCHSINPFWHLDSLGLHILYHTGISLLLTLLIYLTAIGPWDKSILAPTTTNCSTWAIAYRSSPPPFHYLHHDYSPSFHVVPQPSTTFHLLVIMLIPPSDAIASFCIFYFLEPSTVCLSFCLVTRVCACLAILYELQ